MKDIFTWLSDNREWVFSGCGMTVVVGIYGIMTRRRSLSTDNNFKLSQVVSPTISHAPVVNITNNVGSGEKPQPNIVSTRPTNQAPLFALNPLVVTRNLITVTGSSSDDAAEVCIARFKMRDGMTGRVPDRFEVSIDYVERLNASGFPYEHHAGHLNQARWLTHSNDIHELILAMRRSSMLYAVSGVENDNDFLLGDGSLVRLDLVSSRPFASVTLTDMTNGQKWRVEYAIGLNPEDALTVREMARLR